MKYQEQAAGASPAREKPRNLYTGKTYNSADAIADFFKNRNAQKPQPAAPRKEPPLSGFDKLRASASPTSKIQSNDIGGFQPGSHVKHGKYGKGLVLRREGSGDNVKLTVSFPGYGQKKLIEKFANLEEA